MKRMLVILGALLCTELMYGQSSCPCISDLPPDSPNAEITVSRYKIEGATRRQARSLDKCIGLSTGQVIKIDQSFRETLCACSPRPLCFVSVMTVTDTIRGGTILYFRYDKQ